MEVVRRGLLPNMVWRWRQGDFLIGSKLKTGGWSTERAEFLTTQMEGRFFGGDQEFHIHRVESEMSVIDIQVEMLSMQLQIGLKLSWREII